MWRLRFRVRFWIAPLRRLHCLPPTIAVSFKGVGGKGFWLRASSLVFRVWGLGFRVEVLGFTVETQGFRA